MNKFKRFESKGHQSQGYSIGFDINSNGNILASGSVDGCAYIYNFHSTKLLSKIDTFNKNIFNQPCMDVKFNSNQSISNSQFIAMSSWSGEIKIFQIFNQL